MNWYFNKCRRHEAALSLLAAGVLAEDEQQPLSLHLAQCAACRARLESLRTISTHLAGFAENLPRTEAPESLRRRWMSAVHAPAPQPGAGSSPVVEGLFSAWLTGRRLALGSLAATWTLVLFFRITAPEVAAPVAAAQIPSLREVLMVLKVEPPAHLQTGVDSSVRGTRSPAGTLSPRSQRPNARRETMEVA